MESKVIIITVVKSNKSENKVWAVGITGEEQEKAYCKSPYKAMRFAFLLKKRTGISIEDASLKSLSEQIAEQKAEEAQAAEVQKMLEESTKEFLKSNSVDTVLAEPKTEQTEQAEKPKKSRKRTKKVALPVEPTAELVAFL